MIAFGSSILDAEAYRRFAQPGIALAAEPTSEVLAFAAVGPIGRTANLVLDAAAGLDELEALVLVDQELELADAEACAKVRRMLREDDAVAVAGCAGASGVRSLAWWEGDVSCGAVTVRYRDHGGGELPAYAWANPAPAPREVDVVDGSLLVLSPWAVRNLRFDERLGHGFDVDLCLRARAAGRRVMTLDVRAIQHRHSLELVSEHEVWAHAHVRLAREWEGRAPGFAATADGDWKRRARRAEAEREAARTIAYSARMDADARALPLERALADATASPSWRLTAPLRRLNGIRRGS